MVSVASDVVRKCRFFLNFFFYLGFFDIVINNERANNIYPALLYF